MRCVKLQVLRWGQVRIRAGNRGCVDKEFWGEAVRGMRESELGRRDR